jgi:hypothetical protein
MSASPRASRVASRQPDAARATAVGRRRLPRRARSRLHERRGGNDRQVADHRDGRVVRGGVHSDRARTGGARQLLDPLDGDGVGRIARDHDPRAPDEQVRRRRLEPARLPARHRVAAHEAEPVRHRPCDEERLRACHVRHDGRPGKRRAGLAGEPIEQRQARGRRGCEHDEIGIGERVIERRWRGVDDSGLKGTCRSRTRRAPGGRGPATGLTQREGNGAADQAEPEEGDVHGLDIRSGRSGGTRAIDRGAAGRIAAPTRGVRHRARGPGRRAGSGGGPARGAGRRDAPGSSALRTGGSGARRQRATRAARSHRCSGRTTSRQGGA